MTAIGKLGGGAASDSLFLAAVRAFSIATALATTMVLAHRLSLESFGTYAQLHLTITVSSALTTLGLADAANYFFNRADSPEKSRKYTSSIITLQVLVGVMVCVAILISGSLLSSFFDNPFLMILWPYIALRPLLVNVGLTLQVLAVALGRAKAIAFRSLAFSSAKLVAAIAASGMTDDLRYLLAMLFLLDLASAAWFWWVVAHAGLRVQLTKLEWGTVRVVLAFSLPMAVYVAGSGLSREIDKLVIASEFGTEQYAIYSNAATVLPFDVISSSFLVVALPILTRYLAARDWSRARGLFKHYLTIGYLTTVPMALACLLVASDLILVLFGADYLPGVGVFGLYLIASVLRFASVSLVLSASGRTRLLMLVSVGFLVVTVILAILSSRVLGFEGPAAASVLTSAALTVTMITLSLREMRGGIHDVADWVSLLKFVIGCLLIFGVLRGAYVLSAPLLSEGVLRVAIFAPVFVVAVMGLNWRSLVGAIREINRMK